MIDFFEIPQAIARRMDTANKHALKRMGEDIARIGSLNNYKDAQLVSIKLTGESVADITRELSKASGLTEADIEKLYADAARYDYEFAEQFYLNQEQIPYKENEALQRTVGALTRAAQDNCYNLSHSYAFALRDPDGRTRYTSLAAGYKECIDKAVTAVKLGTTDYKTEMRRILKQYADSGVRVVDWESGYSQRIDTAVRRNIMDGLRQVKNETQRLIGREIGADGYEISVHMNPAPDHADIQGKQFSFEEFNELNESLKRPIGTLNCYHTVTAIILGVSRPAYTDEQLEEIKRKSKELIEIDGKKYTRYECTQLQRQIETKIRELKDRKELLKAAGDDVGVRECNRKIRLLKDKYNEITQKAGLDAHYDRMSVTRSTDLSYANHKKSKLTESVFDTYNFTKADSIRPHSVIKELKTSKIGTDTLDYLEKEKVPVRLCYGVDNPDGYYGIYDPFDDIITIFCDKTKTISETATTVIHEATHRKLGHNGTFAEEVECFKAEYLHSKNNLTEKDIEDIIKLVRSLYPDLI